MLKRFLTNLPFNPSMIDNIPSYIAKAKKERRLRALGVFILGLGLLLQIYISAFPAQPTTTSSANDLIHGGITNNIQAFDNCEVNLENYELILNNYGISCKNVLNTRLVNVSSGGNQASLYSLNRLAYGKKDETTINISNTDYYLRPLSESENFNPSGFLALAGKSNSGIKFLILLNSGNLAFYSVPTNGEVHCIANTCPILSVSARDITKNYTNVNGRTVYPGDTLIYTFAASNFGNSIDKDFKVQANLANLLLYTHIIDAYGGNIKNQEVSWPATSIKPGQTITNSISVAVDRILNQSPISSTDPNYYNLTDTTVYGNSIQIKLPASFSKFIEINSTQKLPEGTIKDSLIITVIIFLVSLYFYLRSSLTLKELQRLRNDYRS
jgi:hypothetical protein